MVGILGKSRKFELMWKCIEEMKQFPGFISIVTMSKVMRRLARTGRWNDAVEAFRNMEHLRLSKDSEAMNIAMDALVKGNCVGQAHLVFLEFKDKLHPNLSTFNILIHGWCKARQLDKASLIMGEREIYGFHPGIVSYTSFIEAYCKEKDFQKVDAILDDIQKNGCPPNTLTYTIIMLALGKAKEMTKALEIYEKVRQNGCLLDSLFYSALIFILNKSGRFTDAVAVFEDMSNQDVTPNVLTYNTMIAAACMHSRGEDALQLLIDMKKKSCKPNLKTYAALLKMCCVKKRMKVLNYLLNDMFREDVSPDAGTYTLLVNALCKSGKLEHACAFLKQMVLKGMMPMGNTHKSVIEKLEEKGMSRAKQQIENLMLRGKKGTTREYWLLIYLEPSSYSFPSGHTATRDLSLVNHTLYPMKRPLPWNNDQVDLVSSDDSSSSDTDVEASNTKQSVNNDVNISLSAAEAFVDQFLATKLTDQAFELKTSEDPLIRSARMYQEYMKRIPIPNLRGSLIPCNSWMSLGISIKELYRQPLHYLTNKLLKQWDQARFEEEDHHKPLDAIIHPIKAETNIWLIEEVHRLTTSHYHMAKLWLGEEKYHSFIDPIFPQL
ncbi:hypothetical protein Dimus_013397 [Dionaea muscipula]